MAADSPPDALNVADLALLAQAAGEAGKIALGYFKSANRVWSKGGNSPVSQADVEVDTFLRGNLLKARPDYGWLSEETADDKRRLDCKRVFIVDPIDGTRGFIEGDPRWCIALAVVEAGRPRAAIVHCPALGRNFSARLGGGAFLNGQRISNPVSSSVDKLTGSKRVMAEISARFGARFELLPFVPSLAYRIALVAAGEIDGAFARSGSHEWDLAAPDLILSQAGGRLVTLDSQPCRYNRPNVRAPALLAAAPGRLEALLALAKTDGLLL